MLTSFLYLTCSVFFFFFFSDQEIKPKDVVLVYDSSGIRQRRRLKIVEQSKLSCENLNLFYFLQRKDVSKACFYRTLNFKRLGSFSSRSMKMKKEDIARGLGIGQKSDPSSTHSIVGNKVLPITEKDQCPNLDKKEKTKGDHKTRTISRMKELLRWAAATKAEKGGKYISRKV